MRGLVLAAALLLASGCVTEEVIPPAVVRKDVDGKPTWVRTQRVRSLNEDPRQDERTEAELRGAVAANPKDARAWFRLGEFYERERRYADALAAYQTMQKQIAKTSSDEGKSFVGGHYLVGKLHAVLGEWPEAIESLRRVLRHKPKDRRLALRVPSFREAHYLLGAIYFRFKEWSLADEHLRSCEELGGVDHRVRAMLARCEVELRPVTLQAKVRAGKR